SGWSSRRRGSTRRRPSASFLAGRITLRRGAVCAAAGAPRVGLAAIIGEAYGVRVGGAKRGLDLASRVQRGKSAEGDGGAWVCRCAPEASSAETAARVPPYKS